MLRLFVTLLLSSILFSACSSKKDTAVISREAMFPSPSAFSDECTVNESISDEIAVKIANGTYVDSGQRTASNSNIVQCVYTNPRLTLTVSHFEDAESCKAAHLKDGIGVARKLDGFREIDDIGEDAYVADFAGESLGFRYGNLSVVMTLYDKSKRDEIVEALAAHYASAAD